MTRSSRVAIAFRCADPQFASALNAENNLRTTVPRKTIQPRTQNLPHKQRGVALLMALLVVAIATLIAVRIFSISTTSIARTESQARLDDAMHLSKGMEDWAIVLLWRDAESGDGIDTRNDTWAATLPPLPVPGGLVAGKLEDLDGRFNLNSLVRNGARDPVAMARFARLLTALKIDPALADVAADWIDGDAQVQGQGAEDLEYLRADPPYRAANRAFVHISEMRKLKGVDDKIYARLAPEIAALPIATGFNVNTASVAGFMSLADGISEELAKRLWAQGRAQYRNITDVVDAITQAGVALDPASMQDLKVSSNFFIARADVKLGDREFRFYSLIERTPAGGRVRQRSQGAFF